jgi:hypothetical protein
VGKQKEVHHTPLIWRLRAPDHGSTLGESSIEPSYDGTLNRN